MPRGSNDVQRGTNDLQRGSDKVHQGTNDLQKGSPEVQKGSLEGPLGQPGDTLSAMQRQVLHRPVQDLILPVGVGLRPRAPRKLALGVSKGDFLHLDALADRRPSR
jgi:hypothetical protein